MAVTLQEILLAPGTQPHVVADCYAMIEQEVSDNSGISGTAGQAGLQDREHVLQDREHVLPWPHPVHGRVPAS